MKVEINGIVYTVLTDWGEIHSKRLAELDDYVQSLPDWLKSLLKGEEPKDEPDPITIFKSYAKFIEILSDIPYNVLRDCAFIDLNTIYSYIQKIIVSLLGNVIIELKDIKSFRHLGETFYLPVSDKDIAGNEVPCSELTALEFCEASDLHQAGYLYAGNIVSILCRKEEEKYNEKVCKDRGRWDLPMNVVFEVLYKLSSVHEYTRKIYPNIYSKGKGESKLNSFGWNGKILWLGGVENKEKVENMNVYEFMRLLSFKLAENE